jgi:hypothetical protein
MPSKATTKSKAALRSSAAACSRQRKAIRRRKPGGAEGDDGYEAQAREGEDWAGEEVYGGEGEGYAEEAEGYADEGEAGYADDGGRVAAAGEAVGESEARGEAVAGTPATSSRGSTLKVLGIALGVMLLVWIIYRTVVWYRSNVQHYPVLVSGPIRGANFEMGTENNAVYPVIDRSVRQTGIRLPFVNNKLAFTPDAASEALPMPVLNHQVQFTLSFWMKAENIGHMQMDMTGESVSYAQLFVQNQGQFAVLYDVRNNVLAVKVRIHTGTTVFRFTDSVRVQAWQHVVVALDNRFLDFYVNGALRHSRTLANVPELEFNTWRLYPGKTAFAGMVSCARYFDYALNRFEVQRDYERCKPSDLKRLPRESYWLWWMWYRGSGFTSIFNRPAPLESPAQAAARQGRTVIPHEMVS